MSEYNAQAEKFLKDTDTVFSAKFLEYNKYFPDDKEKRDIYEIRLQRGYRSYTFRFGQSKADSGFKLVVYSRGSAKGKEIKYPWQDDAITQSKGSVVKFKQYCIEKFGSMGNLTIINPVPPSAYSVLAGMTKNDAGIFEDFCSEYGYDTDSIKASKIYDRVLYEWNNLKMLFTDSEIEQMQEIN
jgi:hypothetical protein